MEFGPTWYGQVDSGQLGYFLGALGDLDGDGTGEFWAAALFDPTVGVFGGSVRVMTAASTSDLADSATVFPDVERTFLGVSVAAGPDTDGNGYLEVAIAGDGHLDGRGAVWILDASQLVPGAELTLPGGSQASISGEEPSTYLGHALAALPDFHGDGTAVLAVGVPSASPADTPASGRVDFFAWDSGGALTPGEGEGGLDGYYAGSELGVGIESLPDIDGDGLPDYLVRSASGDLAVILPGGVSRPTLPDDALYRVTGTGAGESGTCTLLGDVDGDGDRDLGCASVGAAWVFTTVQSSPLVTVDDREFTLAAESETVRGLVDIGDADGDLLSETLFSTCDGPGGLGHIGILLGAALDSADTIGVADVALAAAANDETARSGFATAVVPAAAAHDSYAIVGGPSADSAGSDRGGVAAIPIPR